MNKMKEIERLGHIMKDIELNYYSEICKRVIITDECMKETNDMEYGLLISKDNGYFKKMKDSGNQYGVREFAWLNNYDIADCEKRIDFYDKKSMRPSLIIFDQDSNEFTSAEAIQATIENSFIYFLQVVQILLKHKYQKVKIVVINQMINGKVNPLHSAIAGFLKTIVMEKTDYSCMMIDLEQNKDKVECKKLILMKEERFYTHYVLKSNMTMNVVYERAELDKQTAKPLRQNGTYLITGGMGGVGRIVAEYLCSKYEAKVILTGRSELSQEKSQALVDSNRKTGGKAYYVSADISNEEEVNRLIRDVQKKYGKIHGIFHCAGVIKDSFILKKEVQDVDQVIAPKIYGTIYLAEACQAHNMDFMVLFSSLSSITGNMGQCDYAYANAFMDQYPAYAGMKNVISINWPFWKNGGMKITETMEKYLMNTTGLMPIDNVMGMQALETGLTLQHTHLIVGCGEQKTITDKMKQLFSKPQKKSIEKSRHNTTDIINETEKILILLFSEVFGIKDRDISVTRTFQEYGVDSIIVEKFNVRLEKMIGEIPKTLLFEYNTIRDLAKYLVDEYETELIQYRSMNNNIQKEMDYQWNELTSLSENIKETKSSSRMQTKKDRASCNDIAVIGMSFKFPGAETEDELWYLLSNGICSITEVPTDRWDVDEYYEAEPLKAAKEGKVYCKWGGFIDDVDCFDAGFFNIMPKDVAAMDPQERLFLEYTWVALEKAGYSCKRLEKFKKGDLSSNVGVFVGSTSNTYGTYGAQAWENGNKIIPSSLAWSLANRVSYIMNLHGPSIAVDTACSSGLTAVHLACESLINDECKLAVTGGVNLYLHPLKYAAMCQMQMVSPSGKCSALGNAADGFVPGEGIGVLILKKLEYALQDKDQIYGVIKATSVNHGGSTNGYTVPNPNAQAALICDALHKSGIDPRTISSIEAHGTGTKLGDPLEIRGLNKAFKKFTVDNQFCSIGSIKSNIGHLEGAAGVAGIIKVLLEMKHEQLVPSINAEELNVNIPFQQTPFYVQQELQEWKTMIINGSDGRKEIIPKRAGISSFGAGGANCHVILEEYIGDYIQEESSCSGKNIIVLSAKTKDALHAYAKMLRNYFDQCLKDNTVPVRCGFEDAGTYLEEIICKRKGLETKDIDWDTRFEDIGLGLHEIDSLIHDAAMEYNFERDEIYADTSETVNSLKGKINCLMSIQGRTEVSKQLLMNIAYTMQIGRNAYQERVAFIIENLKDGIQKLDAYINDEKQENVWTNSLTFNQLRDSETFDSKGHEPEEIAKEWIKGKNVEWENLYEDNVPQSMVLPTYPFNKEKYWFAEVGDKGKKSLTLGTTVWEEQNVATSNIKWSGKAVLCLEQNYEISSLCNKDTRISSLDILKTYKKNDYQMVFEELKNQKKLPDLILCSFLQEVNELLNGFHGRNQELVEENFDLCKAYLEQKPAKGAQIILMVRQGNPVLEALAALWRTAELENPNVKCRFAIIDKCTPENIRTAIWTEDDYAEVKISADKYYVRRSRLYEKEYIEKSLRIKKNGVYLIAGGNGEIGRLVAKEFCEKYDANIILVGRKENPGQPLPHQKMKYIQCDITCEERVKELALNLKNEYGGIHGILQCAGIFTNGFIIKKSFREFCEVADPKVNGTIYLDKYFADEKLDFFVLFSSLAGEIGKVGQADYSFANNFMDRFAEYRNEMTVSGKRSGATVAIAWPLWKNGGMTLSGSEQKQLSNNIGMHALPDAKGMEALYIALESGMSNILVLYGERDKVLPYIESDSNSAVANKNSIVKIEKDVSHGHTEFSQGQVLGIYKEKTVEVLKKLLGQEIGTPIEKINSDTTFDEYGIDSIVVNQFNTDIEPYFGKLPKTLLFENNTINKVSEYLLENHYEQIHSYFAADMDHVGETITGSSICCEVKDKEENVIGQSNLESLTDHQQEDEKDTEIAVIGLSGKYPMADTLNEYWNNLKNGRDCITEIPKERWDAEKYYDSDSINVKEGKSYCRCGGFIHDVDKFDSLFFHIAPREAEVMDPQERLLLQTAWEVLEDAGYTRKQLEELIDNENVANIGVFAGATTHSYHLLNYEDWLKDNKKVVNPACWSIANRISYVFNFQGPSVFVDTACSSGLSALHLACQSVLHGECDAAIAGGVNLYLHPSKYIAMSQIHMLSPSGKCRAFGDDADGMVPGEGVGAVMIKPLKKAVRDHDHIYAVIKSSAVNHGGKTSGYSVPNPNAQARLINTAVKAAGIDPRTISSVEAHGTGTSLGDPLEIVALTKAYRNYTQDKQYCSIGSVKNSIGHLEAAAGFAGLTKILLEMKYKTLVAEINVENINKNIDMVNTPFYLQTTCEDWKRMSIRQNGKTIEVPRRAGLSSFGAGGANAHFILEEYDEPYRTKTTGRKKELFVLSARNKERLNEYVDKYITFLAELADADDNQSNKVLDFAKIIASVRTYSENDNMLTKETVDKHIEAFSILQSMTHASMMQVFQKEGVFLQKGRGYLIHDLCNEMHIIPRYERLFLSILDMLEQGGYLIIEGDQISVIKDKVDDIYLCSEENESNLCMKYPELKEQIHFLLICIRNYHEIITGKVPSEQVMFPEGSMQLVENLYKNNNILDYFNRNVAKTVTSYVDEKLAKDKNAVVRILEIGAGTGGTSAIVLAKLFNYRRNVQYSYTDISPAFVTFGRKTYAEYADFTEFKLYNAEKAASIQGYEEHSYDIILATNVLHATKNIRKTIKNASNLLKDDGMIVINEVTYRMDSSTVTFGLTEGWWLYEDVDLRIDNCPLLGPDAWNRVLKENNFKEVTFLGLCGKTPEESGQNIIIGHMMNASVSKLSSEEQFKNLIYTSQMGREHFAERLAIVAGSFSELQHKLIKYANGHESEPGIYEGNMNEEELKYLLGQNLSEETVKECITKEDLTRLARLWTKGVDLTFDEFWNNQIVHRISLPTYPFAKVRIWVKQRDTFFDGQVENVPEKILTGKAKKKELPETLCDDMEKFYLVPQWIPQELGIRKDSPIGIDTVFIFKSMAGEKLSRAIGQNYANADVFEIDAVNISTLDKMLSERKGNIAIYFLNGIVNDLTFTAEKVNEHLQNGIYMLMQIVKSFEKYSRMASVVEFKVVTNNIHALADGDRTIPYHAGIAGFIRSMVKEYDQIHFTCVDISIADLESNMDYYRIAEMIIKEPCQKKGEEIVFRKGARYLRKLIPVHGTRPSKSSFRKNGIYVIAGGMGNIGYHLTKYLAETVHAKVILLGRRKKDEITEEKMNEIRELGGTCEYICTDIASRDSVLHAYEIVSSKYGKVNGIINSAMIFKQTTVSDLTREELKEALDVKVWGSIHLYEIFGKEKPDFFMMFSSGQSFTCNRERGHYAAACAFQDAYAEYLERTTDDCIKVINWGFWGANGTSKQEKDYNKIIEDQGVIPIQPPKGMEAIEFTVSSPYRQIVAISVRDFVLQLMDVDMENQLIQGERSVKNDIQGVGVNISALDEKSNEVAEEAFKHYGQVYLAKQFRVMLNGECIRGTKEELSKHLGIIDKYDRLFGALLDILKEGGYVIQSLNQYEFSSELIDKSMSDEMTGIEEYGEKLKSRYDELSDYIRLLSICLSQYPQILRGSVNATEIMFPNSSMELVEKIYKGNSTTDYFNQMVVNIVLQYLENHRKAGNTDKVRVFEVGAGSGGTSYPVIRSIHEHGYDDLVEYIYSDVSRAFTNYGKSNYGKDYRFMRFEVIDVEKSMEDQKVEIGGSDIVIAANVLHATKNIHNTLSNIKTLLKNNGWLILNEATGVLDFSTMTFGLLEGWWLFEDEALRIKNAPLISKQGWKQLLNLQGFHTVKVLGSSNIPDKEIFQNVIVAQGNGVYKRHIHLAEKKRIYTVTTSEKNMKNEEEASIQKNEYSVNKIQVEKKILQVVTDTLQVEETEIDKRAPFMEYGVDSILGVQIVNKIKEQFHIELSTTDLFDHSNIIKLVELVFDRMDSEPIYGVITDQQSAWKEQQKTVELPRKISATYSEMKCIGQVRSIVSEVLEIPAGELEETVSFIDLGVDSILAFKLVQLVNDVFGLEFSTTDLFDHPSIRELGRFVYENKAYIVESICQNEVENPVIEKQRDKFSQENVQSIVPDHGQGQVETISPMTILMKLENDDISVEEAIRLLGD